MRPGVVLPALACGNRIGGRPRQCQKALESSPKTTQARSLHAPPDTHSLGFADAAPLVLPIPCGCGRGVRRYQEASRAGARPCAVRPRSKIRGRNSRSAGPRRGCELVSHGRREGERQRAQPSRHDAGRSPRASVSPARTCRERPRGFHRGWKVGDGHKAGILVARDSHAEFSRMAVIHHPRGWGRSLVWRSLNSVQTGERRQSVIEPREFSGSRWPCRSRSDRRTSR